MNILLIIIIVAMVVISVVLNFIYHNNIMSKLDEIKKILNLKR